MTEKGLGVNMDHNLSEISSRFKQYRIHYPMTQKEMADLSGVSQRSISRFENGEEIGLGNFIKLLDVLGLSANLDMLIPDQSRRPSSYLEHKTRKRASSRKTTYVKKEFKWGDET